jgi:multidrug efflux pump subunit AcrB
MIGMIALAGIADRNAILLLDFIQHVRARGASLKEALIESGAVRFRPILLTAGAAMLGAWPITLDPVFSGLAWALIFGLVVSTAFTLLLVPVVYWMLYRGAGGASPASPSDGKQGSPPPGSCSNSSSGDSPTSSHNS